MSDNEQAAAPGGEEDKKTTESITIGIKSQVNNMLVKKLNVFRFFVLCVWFVCGSGVADRI